MLLAEAFGFDDIDLGANQLGRLSPSQTASLDVLVRMAKRRGSATGVMLFGLLIGAVVAGIIGSGTRVTPGLLAIIAGIVVVPLAATIFLFRVARARLDSFEHPTVHTVQGPARTWTAMQDSYRLEVGSVTFAVLADQTLVIREGQSYRVHYLERRGGLPYVLSIETHSGRG